MNVGIYESLFCDLKKKLVKVVKKALLEKKCGFLLKKGPV